VGRDNLGTGHTHQFKLFPEKIWIFRFFAVLTGGLLLTACKPPFLNVVKSGKSHKRPPPFPRFANRTKQEGHSCEHVGFAVGFYLPGLRGKTYTIGETCFTSATASLIPMAS
jgi:hypothetical protein